MKLFKKKETEKQVKEPTLKYYEVKITKDVVKGSKVKKLVKTITLSGTSVKNAITTFYSNTDTSWVVKEVKRINFKKLVK